MADKPLILVLGDQLSPALSSLMANDSAPVLMAELADEASYVRHHQQKIALIFSAMRHFAEQYAKRTDTYFCSDLGVTAVVIEGLAKNKD
ncbi:MAG: cryptochrome/photolyase family protein, partial [Parvibaculales bacterium]